MDDKIVKLLFILAMLAVLILSSALAIWIVLRLRKSSDRPLSADGAGGILVPTRRLRRTLGFMGQSENGLSQRLEIVPDGLRFKVFKPDHWLFSDITEIDLPWVLFGTRLMVRNRGRVRLYIYLHNEAAARDFLRALPASLPLSPRAAGLRDGVGS